LASVRSFGTAFGAAIAWAVGEHCRARRRYRTGAVGNAVSAVYIFWCVPFGLAALLIFRFVHTALGKPEAEAARGY